MNSRVLVASLACLVPAAPALADEKTRELEFAVEYAAPADCPPEAEFEAALVSRVPGARAVPKESAGVRFRVELSDQSQTAPSVIWVELADGTSTRREVRDASCAEAAASMAVIAAMVLDARRARDAQPDASGEAVARAPAAQPVEPSTKKPDAKPLPKRAPTRSSPPAPESPDSVFPVTPAERQEQTLGPLRWGAAVAGTWESEVAPSAPFGIYAAGEALWDHQQIWSPSLRLGVVYTLAATETTDDGDASFRLLAGRLTACPVRFGSRSFLVFACAEFDLGELRGEGTRTRNRRIQSMLWLAGGPAVRGEVPLGRIFALEGVLGLRILAHDDRFVFEPGAVIHDVSRVSAGLGVGVAGRLP